jgi:hypothetical protein
VSARHRRALRGLGLLVAAIVIGRALRSALAGLRASFDGVCCELHAAYDEDEALIEAARTRLTRDWGRRYDPDAVIRQLGL